MESLKSGEFRWSKRAGAVYVRTLHPKTGEIIGLVLPDSGGRSAARLGVIKIIKMILNTPNHTHEFGKFPHFEHVGDGMKQGIFRVYWKE